MKKNKKVSQKNKQKFKIIRGIQFFIRIYQLFISPFLGKRCRFFPSCSEYLYQAIQKYGLLKGFLKGFKRILRCHPFNQGGVDMP